MIRLLPRSMQQQLMLLTSCALLIAIGAHAAYTLREQENISRNSIERQASALARNLAIASAGLMLVSDLDTIDGLIGRTADFPDVHELLLTDAAGKIQSHFKRAQDRRVKQVIDPPGMHLKLPAGLNPLVLPENADEQERMVAWHPVSAGSLLGWVKVDFDTTALDEIRQRILMTTLIAAVLSVLGISLLLIVFLRRPMSALEHARRFAVGLNRSNGETLPPMPGPFEIEDLETALNYASVSLHEQRTSLADTIEQLRIKESVLSDRNEQLDAIFALSPDGFVSFDHSRRVKYVSPAFRRLSGFDESSVANLDEEAFSQRLEQICLAESSFPGVAAMRARSQLESSETNSPPTGGYRQLIRLAGSGKRVLEVGLRLSQSTTVSQILYFRDVTYETEVDRMKSEFLSHAAHELRTPMSSILGFSELLLEMELDEETRRDLLETIHRQTKWLVEIINELLDLSRIESRRDTDLKIEDVDLTLLVRDTVAYLSIDREHWPLKLDLPETPTQVATDPSKLRQALMNVIGNAHKYSPEGGEIRVTIKQADGQVGVEVSDHGIGMTPAQIEHFGERFWRADTSGKTPGTGLGIAIVKEILKLLGGEIAAISQPGLGTSITLWLPKIHEKNGS